MGFFDGLLDGVQNPLFLGGVGLMGGGAEGLQRGLLAGNQFSQQKKRSQAAQAGLAGIPGLNDAEREALAADPESAISYIAKMAQDRNDPMAGMRRQMAEQNLLQAKGENAMLPQRQQLLRAQIAQAQMKSADPVMTVGGNLVRVPRDGGAAEEIYTGKPKMTPAQTAVDKAYAKSYEEDVANGGLADAAKNNDQLAAVLERLTGKVDQKTGERVGGENLTGPVVGLLPDAINNFWNPKAVDARQQVEEIVQRNLRLVLGAQFTQKEGDALIARAYNPRLDEATNAKRVERLMRQMNQAVQAKQAAAQYYEANGTLQGFKGRLDYSMKDFEDALDGPDKLQGSLSETAAPKSAAEYARLPSGTRYTDPEGNMRVKP